MNSRKKPEIGGFSADYRAAYGDSPEPPAPGPTETERTAPEPPRKDLSGPEKEREVPPGKQREADDFLPEGGAEPDDALLSRWSDDLPEEPPASPQEKKKRRPRRRRYGVAVGVLVLLFALLGVGFLAVNVGKMIYRAATDDSGLRAYDTFLAPAVMQDPAPFASPDRADEEFIQNAALWKTIVENGEEQDTDYDDAGRLLIPLGDVVDACRALFGPDCQLQPKTPAQETFYEYDAEKNQFHVSLYSSDSSYQPYTQSAKKRGGETVLRVGYVSPSDPWRTQTSSAVAEPTPAKTMEYVLHTDPSTKKEYLYAVREVK